MVNETSEARPAPPSPEVRNLLIGLRGGRRLCAGREPTPRGGSNQKHRIVAHDRNVDLERKLGVSDRAEGRGWRVNGRLDRSCRAARVAYERADDHGDWTGSPAE